MSYIRQKVITREYTEVDEGCFGFHDYVTKYEPFNNFVDRVTKSINDLCIRSTVEIINIVYPDPSIAIIIYKE